MTYEPQRVNNLKEKNGRCESEINEKVGCKRYEVRFLKTTTPVPVVIYTFSPKVPHKFMC